MAKSQSLYIHHFCPECGSTMDYKGGIRKFSCSNCKYERALQKNSDQVVDRPLASNVSFKEFRRGMGDVFALREGQCKGCSSYIAVPEGEELNVCPYCEGTEFEPTDRYTKVLEPKDMIPFTIPHKKAQQILKRYLRKRNYLFLPNSLYRTADKDRLRGVFVPLFLIDAFTRSTWKGDAGKKVRQNDKDKMVWEPYAGYWENTYDRESVNASKGIQGNFFDQIGPYDVYKLVPYDPLYLRDWYTEMYQKDEIDGVKAIDKKIENDVKRLPGSRKRGYQLKELKYARENRLLAFRHILVPVWIATYQYRGKNFQLMINGQKGFVAGDRPLSMRKILTAIITGIIVISLLVWIFS